jgi:membrane-associated phospholipid phosphatase
MENQRERNIPLMIMFAYCLVLYLMFVFKAPNNILPKYFYALPLSGAVVTGSFMVINRWIKISMHAGGAGILVGYLIAFAKHQAQFEFWIILAAVLASGVTIASRLYLNKHRPIEVYTGWSLAVLITFLCNDLYPFIVVKG